jgi:hypothetical protein
VTWILESQHETVDKCGEKFMFLWKTNPKERLQGSADLKNGVVWDITPRGFVKTDVSEDLSPRRRHSS